MAESHAVPHFDPVLCVHWRSFQCVHGRQNRGDHTLVADTGIDHHVIETTSRPIGIEIALHKCDSIAVDRVQQFSCCFLALAQLQQPLELLRVRRIKKNMKGICTLTQKVWRAPAYDDAITSLTDSFHDLLPHGYESVCVKRLCAGQRDAALVAVAQKHFDQTLKRTVDALRASLDGRTLHIGDLRDLFRQRMIPDFPAEPLGQLAGNFAASASIFAFDRDDAVHQLPLTLILPSLWAQPTSLDAERVLWSHRDRM